MNDLAYVMAYFCKNYPHKNEISNARLTKMVYLADLFSVETRNIPITKIKWYFDNYGPYVDSIKNEAENNPIFEAINNETIYGTPKLQIKLTDNSLNLPNESRDYDYILDKVIQETKHLNWNDFIRHVYNTNPVKQARRYSYLNLNSAGSHKQS